MSPQPRRRLQFSAIAVLLILSRTADAATTYMVTPDLRHEANPLVSVLGMGWAPLIIVQVLGVAAIIALSYWEIFRSSPSFPSQQGLTFAEFAPIYYFGRKRPLTDFLWRMPKGWKLNLRVGGYAIPRGLIAVGFFIASSSFMLVHHTAWRDFYRWAFPYVVIIPFLLIVAATNYQFLQREYQLYLAQTIASKPVAPLLHT